MTYKDYLNKLFDEKKELNESKKKLYDKIEKINAQVNDYENKK